MYMHYTNSFKIIDREGSQQRCCSKIDDLHEVVLTNHEVFNFHSDIFTSKVRYTSFVTSTIGCLFRIKTINKMKR